MTSRDAVDDVRVAAVVVTYNRKELLMECLEALLRQTRPLQAIYIIDNASTDGTPELLHREGYTPSLEGGTVTRKNLHNQEEIRITHIRLPENTGGAGGFHEGVKRAYHDGYDWIWLMDDDAEPLPDSLKILLPYISKKVSALCSAVVKINGEIDLNQRGNNNTKFPSKYFPVPKDKYRSKCVRIDVATFVGILINSKKISEVGFPRKEFFIHQDDTEYSLRLRKVGDILLVPSSIFIHKESGRKTVKRKIFNKKSERTPYENFWIRYYGIRNSLIVSRTYSSGFNFYFEYLKMLILICLGILIFDDRKLKRIELIITAFLDGLKENFDNEKAKKMLYADK